MLACQKHHFGLDSDIQYLNNAAYGPLPNKAAAAAAIGIGQKVNPQLKTPADHFINARVVRSLFRQLINAEHPEQIAIIPAVSYGMATVAANLHRLPNMAAKQNIVILENEFPNDNYAFERVAKNLDLTITAVAKPEGEPVGKKWNESLLSSISQETAMVVVPHVHWIEGIVFDLEQVGVKCREMGALLIIDGTQSVGALPFDVEKVKPDALICGAYKWLLGPYAVGLAYYGAFFDEGIPLEETWMNRINSEGFSDLTRLEPSYYPMAQRYNMGEFSQFIQLPMVIESLKLLIEWGVENIQNYTRVLTEQPISKLREMGCLIESDEYRAGHLFALKFPEKRVDVNMLNSALTKRKIYVSKRGNGLRISVNVFNTPADLAALVDVVAGSFVRK